MDRYEQLRRRALAGDAGGWRLGLAVLQHRGVPAWLAAWRGAAAPARAPVRVAPVRSLPAGAGDQLVGVLASMALGALATG